jgi:hypothetical protein
MQKNKEKRGKAKKKFGQVQFSKITFWAVDLM